MRVCLVCLLAALTGGAALAQSRQPATKEQPKRVKAVKDGKDNKSDVPEKAGPDTVGGKTLKEWVNDLSSGDPSRRAIALLAIPNFGEDASKTVKYVLDRLHDADVSPRANACIALRVLAVDPDDVKAVVKELGKALRRDTQAIVRYEAAITLRRFSEDAAEVIPDLIARFTDGDSWEIRHACIAVMSRAAVDTKNGPDKRVVLAFSDRLRAERFPPTYQEKLEMIIGLGSMGRPKEPEVLSKAIGALAFYANAQGVNVNRSLKLWAFAGLVALVEDSKQVESHLGNIAKFMSDKNKTELRVQAMGALSAFGTRSKKYVPDLIKLLADPEPTIVQAAASALTSIADKSEKDEIVTAFLELLKYNGVTNKDAPALEKFKDTSKAATAVIALVNLKANLKDVHDTMDRVRKNDDVDPALRRLIDQAQKQLKNPPKEMHKDKK